MFKTIKRNLPAIGAAVVGMVIIGGGTAYAHGMIGAEDIKKNAVGSSELRPDAVKGNHVNEGALSQRHLTDGLKEKVNATSQDGQDGVSGYEVHNREVRWSNATAGETVVPCPAGKVATGGGFVAESIRGGSATVTEAAPVFDAATSTATGWVVRGTSTGEANVKAWVTCANITTE